VKDKLEAICSILNQFSEACNENYSAGYLTVDESSAASRGRSSYTLYMEKQSRAVWFENMSVQILRQHILKPQVYTGMTDG